MGLDLGQSQDFTSLAIAERVLTEPKPSFHLRHIQCFKLGISYPTIINEVKTLADMAPSQRQCTLVVDRTGCGRPVFDMFTAARLSCPLYGVSIHGGESVTHEGRHWKVPKRDLVATVQVLLQSGRLKIADSLPDALILQKELLNFKVTIDPATANESFAAWRESDYDDLVLATALACWIVDHQRPVRSLF
jgi:hypothetical protein